MDENPVAIRLRYLAANIRAVRLSCGWTQEELAEAAGLTPRYVQTLESKDANPRAEVLVRVALALRVPVGRLFEKARLPKKKPGRPPKTV